jgi:hypothetical protein
VIYTRADAEKDFMGLMTFPGSRPYLKDVVVAKNYLNEKELRSLGQIVSGYLDFAERQAEREQAMTMKDWAEHLNKILTMSGENLLQGAGTISYENAIEITHIVKAPQANASTKALPKSVPAQPRKKNYRTVTTKISMYDIKRENACDAFLHRARSGLCGFWKQRINGDACTHRGAVAYPL